jgi:hypothetical protein
MNYPRRNHTLTTLASGDVLAVGDFGRGQPATSAEVYRTRSQTWEPAGDSTTPRAGHDATLLLDHRVLVTGGLPAFAGESTTAVEAFRPIRQR